MASQGAENEAGTKGGAGSAGAAGKTAQPHAKTKTGSDADPERRPTATSMP